MKKYRDSLFNELIIDNFAGGGGTSVGIELALGRPVDVAINHDPDAIAMHKVNHPFTQHYQESVWDIDPRKVTGGRPVGLAWFSPDCKHFSKAKGGKPVDKHIRGLAWIVLRWAGEVRPRVIILENVEEFQTWGPVRRGKPIKSKQGDTFRKFVAQLKALGYAVDWRELKACDYGVPTIRKRLYLIARCDGKPIVFPKPTHGGKGQPPYRTAAECIDWSLPCPSIFGRKKDLAVNTQRRIARGLDKFVIKNPRPFIMEMNFQNAPQDPEKPMTTQTTANHHYVVSPHLTKFQQNSVGQRIESPLDTVMAGATRFGAVLPSLVQYHTEQTKGEVRGQKVSEPILTVDGSPRYAVNACYISKYFSGEKQSGTEASDPLPTVTAIDHNAIVAANIVHYYGGADHASAADNPLPTVTAKPRHFLTESHLCVLRNNMDCKDEQEPMPTLTTSAGHIAEVRTYLRKYDEGTDLRNWSKVRELLNKYAGYNIADDEVLILLVNGVEHFIADVGLRMLKARELKLAQGFPEDYIIDIEPYIGKKYSEAKQIARLGNAVCPPMAKVLVRANLPEICAGRDLNTVAELEEVMLAS